MLHFIVWNHNFYSLFLNLSTLLCFIGIELSPGCMVNTKAPLRQKRPNTEFFSRPYFLTFGLSTARCSVFLFIQSKCGKIRTRKNPVFGHFSRSACILWRSRRVGWYQAFLQTKSMVLLLLILLLLLSLYFLLTFT